MSTTPAINCSPVSTTPPITTEVWDSAKLTPAAEVGHGRRYCHWNSHEKAQRPLTRSETPEAAKTTANQNGFFSFGGLRGLWSRCVGCAWMQLFMAVPMTSSAAVADFGGRRYRRFIPFNFLLSLAAPHLHGVLVLVTGKKFIAGVVVTADNWSPVSTTNLSPVSTTPAITENPWQGLIAGVNDTGDKFFAGVVDTTEQLFAGVVDTGDKH